MTERQLTHLKKVQTETNAWLQQKFTAGAEEHEGEPELEDLSVIQLIDMSIDEAIDQVVYLMTLRDRIMKR